MVPVAAAVALAVPLIAAVLPRSVVSPLRSSGATPEALAAPPDDVVALDEYGSQAETRGDLQVPLPPVALGEPTRTGRDGLPVPFLAPSASEASAGEAAFPPAEVRADRRQRQRGSVCQSSRGGSSSSPPSSSWSSSVMGVGVGR